MQALEPKRNQLTKNFTIEEFNSKDGSEMPYPVYLNVLKVAYNLQALRNIINVPIGINSAYRSKEHNKSINGVVNSKHITGEAADIVVYSIKPDKLYLLIDQLIKEEKLLEGGLGLYDTFIHYDIRGYRARWDNSRYNE